MRSSRWWRIESEREMQPLRYNPTIIQIRDFEGESTKPPEKEHEGGQEDPITRGTKMSVHGAHGHERIFFFKFVGVSPWGEVLFNIYKRLI